MDDNTIKTASKAQLRALCRANSIQYSRLTIDGMRAALRKLIKPDERSHVAVRLSDPVPVQVVQKVTAPSVLELLKRIPAGDTFSVKEIAKRTGSTEASVRTVISNCNSAAPSNARFHNTGLRFATKRGEDQVARTQ